MRVQREDRGIKLFIGDEDSFHSIVTSSVWARESMGIFVGGNGSILILDFKQKEVVLLERNIMDCSFRKRFDIFENSVFDTDLEQDVVRLPYEINRFVYDEIWEDYSAVFNRRAVGSIARESYLDYTSDVGYWNLFFTSNTMGSIDNLGNKSYIWVHDGGNTIATVTACSNHTYVFTNCNGTMYITDLLGIYESLSFIVANEEDVIIESVQYSDLYVIGGEEDEEG